MENQDKQILRDEIERDLGSFLKKEEYDVEALTKEFKAQYIKNFEEKFLALDRKYPILAGVAFHEAMKKQFESMEAEDFEPIKREENE